MFEVILIHHAHIKTMAGKDLEDGCLLIQNGKIAEVAPTIIPPEGVEVVDAQGRLVTPGCIDAR